MSNIYGEKLKSEKILEEKKKCHDYIQDLNLKGINERQRLYMIYLLSLELENIEAMRDLSIVSKEFCEENGIMLTNFSE